MYDMAILDPLTAIVNGMSAVVVLSHEGRAVLSGGVGG